MWPFKKLFTTPPYAPTITDVQIILPELQPHRKSEHSMAWLTPEGEAIQIGLFPPCSWPFPLQQQNNDLFKDEALKKRMFDYWQTQAQVKQGAVVEVRPLKIQGIPALQGIFKYHVPDSLALIYIGIIWLPFKNFLYQINIEAVEHGTTGMREAVVNTLERNQGKWPEQQEPEMLDTMEALLEKLKQTALQRTLSDDENYDAMFPHHPLTRVRDILSQLPVYIQLSAQLCKQPVYDFNSPPEG